MPKTVGAQTMMNDDHMFTWACETGQRWDEVDDDDANYHGLCGTSHTPGDRHCPVVAWSDD